LSKAEYIAACWLHLTILKISVILVPSKVSWRMFCLLHKILYDGSGAPSGIYQCAIMSDRDLEFSRCLAIKISVTEFPPYVSLIVGRRDVDGQSFAPIGLHTTEAASDWLLIKRHCTG
jgi:hypothetical protein